jgi:hypothetical protein
MKLIGTAVAGIALALAVAAPVAASMQTPASDGSFPGNSGRLTFWDDSSYHDTPYELTPGDFSRDLDDIGFGDRASSFVNKTSYYFLIYRDNNYGGTPILCVRPHSHIANMDSIHFGDQMSSIRTARQAISSCNGATAIGTPN